MQVVISTIGKFHLFDTARQLDRRKMLARIYTGYPRFKLRNEALPPNKIRSFTLVHLSTMLVQRKVGRASRFGKYLTWLDKQLLDRHVAATMPACDAFIGLSSGALISGGVAKRRGSLYICDRGAAHIRVQNELLADEFRLNGQVFPGIDERIMQREEDEYALADIILVPSTFAMNSFLSKGVSAQKLRLLSYGVNLSRFAKVAPPANDAFEVLFVGAVSLQKGVPYLIKAFEQLGCANKRLTIIGSQLPETGQLLRDASARLPIRLLGHVPQPELKEYMSRSHVMVLPSVQDGFGMVMAQAMACGCPVIGTTNTGAFDLFTDGVEGYIVEPRSADAIADRLQCLADARPLRDKMSDAALGRVTKLGGWDSYGDRLVEILSERSSN